MSAPSPAPRRRLGNRLGMTLVEVVAVAVISVAVVGAVLELAISASGVLGMMNAHGILQVELSRATDAFSQDVRLAATTPASSASGAFVRDLTSLDNGLATFILRLPSITPTQQVIPGSFDDIIYTFDRATGTLQRIVDATEGTGRATAGPEPDQTRTVARQITDAIFNANNAPPPPSGEATIQLIGSRTENRRPVTLTVHGRSALRNL